jgi:hypothetical protein
MVRTAAARTGQDQERVHELIPGKSAGGELAANRCPRSEALAAGQPRSGDAGRDHYSQGRGQPQPLADAEQQAQLDQGQEREQQNQANQ